jgi:hypothetical protein
VDDECLDGRVENTSAELYVNPPDVTPTLLLWYSELDTCANGTVLVWQYSIVILTQNMMRMYYVLLAISSSKGRR